VLLMLSVVEGVRPVTEPLWLSPAAGAALPSSSVPWPRADQALAPAAAVNVQVKSCETVAARVTLAGLKDEQAPPPVTFTFVNVPLPVLVSVTTVITAWTVLTAVGALLRVSEVEVVTPRTEPLWLSPSAGAAVPSSSVPRSRADQALAPAAAVNVQVKSCEAVAARVTMAGLKDEQAPPPVTFTFVNVPLPVLVSV